MIEKLKSWLHSDAGRRVIRTAWQSIRAALVAAAVVVVGAIVGASYDVMAVPWGTTASLAGGFGLVALLTTAFALKDNTGAQHS